MSILKAKQLKKYYGSEENLTKALDGVDPVSYTHLQDIINETNLSKGAIYHHFSSKEEIFEAIFHRIGEENTNALAKVRDDQSLNGLEKLRAIFKAA